MVKPDIALTGLSRSGKDTVAARLVEHHGYVRVAFADKLKEAALKVDPGILYGQSGDWLSSMGAVRLSTVVDTVGWERAKDAFPEVRRFLQDFGQAIRDMDPVVWINQAFTQIWAAKEEGRPVVVTDVRYANEADALLDAGFDLVRVVRPGLTPGDHPSEREMLEYPVPTQLQNDGTLKDLERKVDRLVI